MTVFSPEQTAAVRELRILCRQLRAELVLIGAVAFRIQMEDMSQHTEDMDVAVAIDLDDYAHLAALL